MKKTIPTSISHTIFYIQEDAYQKLDAYLSEVRSYFASYPDSKEIIEDIESRIEEQLLELSQKDKTDRIVTNYHIDTLIQSMGRPEEFGSGEGDRAERINTETTVSPRKKLYRDKENAVVGGVAAGLASYFGINPIIIRIIFFASVFLGGFGIISYIFLWFAVPEAKTATQKLEMEGSPVTLGEVKKIVEGKMEEVGGKDRIKKGSEKLRQFFIDVARKFFKAFGRVISIILNLIAFFGTIFLVTALVIIATNSPLSLFGVAGIPLVQAYIIIGTIFILLLIPLLFLGLAGNSISHPKRSHKTLAGVLALIWIIAIMAGTVMAFHLVKNRDLYASSIKGTELTTIKPPIANFSGLIVKDSQNVRIVQGETASIEITGRERDVNAVDLIQDGDTFSIKRKHIIGNCFFCGTKRPDILIIAPRLSSLIVENGSNVSFEGTADTLTLVMMNASRVTLTGKAETLELDIKNASSLDAKSFIVTDMSIGMENASHAKVNITASMKGMLSNASTFEQYGEALIDNIKLENGSRGEKK